MSYAKSYYKYSFYLSKIKRILLFFNLLILSPFGFTQNFINGSFENNAGFVLINPTMANFNSSLTNCEGFQMGTGPFNIDLMSVTYGTAQSGSWFLGITPLDGVSTKLEVPLAIGVSYTFSFWSTKYPSYPSSSLQVGATQDPTNFGSLITTIAAPTSSTWTKHSVTFIASNTATHITISGDPSLNSGNRWTFIDNFEKISTLPVELVNFNASSVNNKLVQLDWQTASEINNDYFTIERSVDGTDWKELTQINGSGSSSSLLNYSVNDYNPYLGVSYYRLKQTDFDGQYSYSQISSVNIQKTRYSEIEIYPNPTKNQITILGSSYELEQVKIYNVLGQDVTILTEKIINNESKIIINLLNLNTGMYYVKTKTTSNKVYKQ